MKHSSILLNFPSLSSLTIISSSHKTTVKDSFSADSSIRPTNNISTITSINTSTITTTSISTSSSHASIPGLTTDTTTMNNNTSTIEKHRSFINQLKSFFQHKNNKSKSIHFTPDSNSSEVANKIKRKKMIEKRRSLPPTTTAKKPSTCDYPQHYSNNIYQQQPTQQQSTGGRNRRHTRCLSDYGELIRNKHSSKDCPIGTGAFATVILTRRKDKYSNTTSLYAIKVFQPTRYSVDNKNKRTMPIKKMNKKEHNKMTVRSEAHFMKKIISEFCISSSLQHPNIVKTIDLVLDEKNRFCTVMEYCSGGDLYNFIKEGRLTCIDEINGYFKQLLNGLAYLHRIGVAHRDIKPENLLLVGEGTLKITDFGEADVFREAHHQQKEYVPSNWRQQQLHSMEPTTTYSLCSSRSHSSSNSVEKLSDGFCGSTPYIAPEIFLWAKQGYKASQADVWSAGIVYFCMRFNGVPFYSATQSDTNYRLYQKCFYTYHQQQQRQHRQKSTMTLSNDNDSENMREDEEEYSSIRQRIDNQSSDDSSLSLSTYLNSTIASSFDIEPVQKLSHEVIDYPAFRDLDSDAKDMLYSMLNPDPEQRYTIQDVLNIPWLAEVRPPTEEIEENTSQYYDTPQRPSQHLEHCSQCFDDTNTTTVRDANYRRSIA